MIQNEHAKDLERKIRESQEQAFSEALQEFEMESKKLEEINETMRHELKAKNMHIETVKYEIKEKDRENCKMREENHRKETEY